MSDSPIIKRVVARAVEAGLDRPKCFYCHHPLHTKGGKCKHCGAPRTPLDEPPTPTEERKVKDQIKRERNYDSPALFFK